MVPTNTLSESCTATTHNLPLTDQFSVELTSIEREIYIKIYAVECSLWRVHALKVLFEILARKIRSQSDNLLYACSSLVIVDAS